MEATSRGEEAEENCVIATKSALLGLTLVVAKKFSVLWYIGYLVNIVNLQVILEE
jgi:hypothetical protein